MPVNMYSYVGKHWISKYLNTLQPYPYMFHMTCILHWFRKSQLNTSSMNSIVKGFWKSYAAKKS